MTIHMNVSMQEWMSEFTMYILGVNTICIVYIVILLIYFFADLFISLFLSISTNRVVAPPISLYCLQW